MIVVPSYQDPAMIYLRSLTACLLILTILHAADEPPLVAPGEARTPTEELKTFKLPPGFEAQLVASEPDIAKPMNLAFDAKGRLWVTSSLEYPFPAQGRAGRDMVSVLEDFGPDGKARKIHTFAKDLNIPIGLLPRHDGALVYSINSLDALKGEVGHLYVDRTKLYQGFGTRDTHGMVNSLTTGYDGWIYACHGYANDSVTRGTDGQELRMNSGNVFRFKADGSHVEIFTRGQVNPFGLAFDPWGNLYSADCHTKPITQLIRGAHYDSFGKPHDGLGYGPNMMGHLHDSTGLCGIVYYDADAYPKAYRDTMYVCNVVTCRINHDKIRWNGSTPEAVLQPDFMKSDDPWYRPVYMTIGPDGCIYIADFYNRIIGHYEVPLSHPGRDRTRGRIWRIVYKGADAKATPAPHGGDLTKCSDAELVQAWSHPNIAVRMMALNLAVERGSRVQLSSILNETNAHVMKLWYQYRTRMNVEETVFEALKSTDPVVQTHALKIVAELAQRSSNLTNAVLPMLEASSAHVRRAAADALGTDRQHSFAVLRSLLAASNRVPVGDTHLLHTIRIALRNQLAQFPSADREQLTVKELQQLSDITLGITTESGGKIALRCLKEMQNWTEYMPLLVRHVNRYAPEHAPAVHAICAVHKKEQRHFAALLQAEVQGLREAGKPLSDAIQNDIKELADSLTTSTDPSLLQTGIELCTLARMRDQFETMKKLVFNETIPEAQRTAALNALPNLDRSKTEGIIMAVLMNPELPWPVRERAAAIAVDFSKPEVREKLLAGLKEMPSRLANVVAYQLANTVTGAEQLLQTVEAGKLPPNILLTTSVQSRIMNHKRKEFTDRYAKLTTGLPPADVKMTELINKRISAFKPQDASLERGAKLFTQHCANCHQLANTGAKIGPQLDGVGVRGVERLLEDILDPNRNVDQAFRATVLVLKDGRTLTGLVLRQDGNLVVIADNQGKEQKIDKNDIDESKQTNLSPMPATFDTQMKEAELNDLLVYLLSKRAKP